MENSGKVLEKGQKLEVMVEGGSTPEATHHLQKSRSARLHAHRMWWNNVKLVLILDAVVAWHLQGLPMCQVEFVSAALIDLEHASVSKLKA